MAKERLKSPRARLFVALELPDAVREGIVAWQRRELGDPALRPVKPESLHITLVFLGYQAEKDLDRIAKAALGAPDAAPEVRLEPEPVGVPKGKRPRLFALDAPSEGAVELQRRVEEGLVGARFYEPERRPFWPHLTVARVKPERRGSRKPALVETPPGPLPEHTFPPFRPTRLVLFRSHLRPTGAEYEPMAELELPTAPDDQGTER
ncbi:MAG TPA: RNA 2',3'-cyclic phosphodiesterase [Solirubrobacterales bacterium]|jgi:2'-5' RNA ligase|nr:RNA 2',3'-cyclic phosphodiesterase [Solirubrobacterales bacterium]